MKRTPTERGDQMARYMLTIYRADDQELLRSIHLSPLWPLLPIGPQLEKQLRRNSRQFGDLPHGMQLMAHLTLAIGASEIRPLTRRPLYFQLVQEKVVIDKKAHGPAVA